MTASASQEWFTVEPIDSRTHAISEYGHWERVHCYLFIGEQRAALIDSGTGIGRIRPVVERLTDRPVLVITTHAHWDHTGGHGEFDEIAVHKADRAWLEDGIPIPVEAMRRMLMKEPFKSPAPPGFDPEKWAPFTGPPTLVVEDNHVFDLGGRALRALHTPGHSPGHICLWEEETGYLASGDLLYEGTLLAFYESTDPAQYAASIARLKRLEGIRRLLPGHNRLDIPPDLLDEAHHAFQSLEARGLLHHGSGRHSFGRVAVHL